MGDKPRLRVVRRSDRPPPAALDAERHLLGALLIDGKRIADVVQLVGSVDFYHPAHAAIFAAMDALHEDGKPIDQVTVAAQMRASDTFRALRAQNGEVYFADLASAVVTVENIAHYARLVAETARQRRVLEQIDDARVALAAGDEDVARAILDGILADGPKPSAPTRRAADIPIERVDWIWRGRIARSMISLLDGDPGLGKSTLLAEVTARITCGEPFPYEIEGSPPAAVVMVSFEDSAAHVIVPRLIAAGADLARVHLWNVADVPFTLPDSLGALEKRITAEGAVLVIVDPLMAALGADVDAHHDSDIRRVLAAVSAVADRTRAAFVCVRHLNKATGGKAIYRGGGSIGIIAAARVGLLLDEDPSDSAARVLAVAKCNVGRKLPSLGLRLVPAVSPAPGVEVARVEWTGEVNIGADELLADPDERTAIGEAVELLRSMLADGPVAAMEAFKQAKAVGISERTLKRAKSRLDIGSSRATPTGPWRWSLPSKDDR